jgi:hemerythrin-like domain-containing protein
VKREKFLWPLTQGHHRGLVAAKNIKNRITQMGDENREKELTDLWTEVSKFWEEDLKTHFAAEEEMLKIFMAHAGPGDPGVTRILSDHRTMEQLVKKGFKEDLLRLADFLTTHIRYEEETFFGRVEKILTPAEIQKEEERLSKLKNGEASCQISPTSIKKVNLPSP